MADNINLAATASRYQVSCVLVDVPSLQWTQVLFPDPQRWYLLLRPGWNATGPVLWAPVPLDGPVLAPTPEFDSIELKYRDCPALVTGAWYCFPGQNCKVIVTAERFLR